MFFTEKVILQFSLIKNWKKVVSTDGNDDFVRLKSIQGVRVLVMIIVIIIHATIKILTTFFERVEELEKVCIIS